MNCLREIREKAGLAGGTKSLNEKFAVLVKFLAKYNKRWVEVKVWGKTTWIPSFHDLFRVIRAICYCEDLKYPKGEGRKMVARFLQDCCDPLAEWEELKKSYEIPDRITPTSNGNSGVP